MKKIKLLISLLIIAVVVSYGQDFHERIDTSKHSMNPDEVQKAKKIVVDFTNFLFQKHDVDSLLSKCSLPLVMDGKLIGNSTELKEKFTEIIEKTSKNSLIKITVDSTYIFGTRKEILNGLIPLNIYFVVNTLRFELNGQSPTTQSVFAVQMSDKPKIIGITAE